MGRLFCLPPNYPVQHHFNARWYDAQTARFISEDPVRDGGNWFAYVGNKPLKYVDPTGLLTDYNEFYGDVDENTFQNAQYNPQSNFSGQGSPTNERDNTYNYERVLRALKYTEEQIAEGVELPLGGSQHLWRDAGCRGWAATINLMLAVDQLGGSISLDEAILIVNNEIGTDGLLTRDEISSAITEGIISYTQYSDSDFQIERIQVLSDHWEKQLTGSKLVYELNKWFDNENRSNYVFGIALASLQPDVDANTHFIVARSVLNTARGYELGFIGTSRNDDIDQNRSYVFYNPGEQELTYRINRVDLFIVSIRRERDTE
jgi:hypothetical protein